MKKILSLILTAALLCALLPSVAFAADGDFTIENGVLTKYNGSGGYVTIPDGVTSIGDDAFRGCDSLTCVTIPNSVTTIRNQTFRGCENLTSVTIGNSVTSIGYAAFAECTSLNSVTIPNSVTIIGSSAFACCSSLTSVTIPNSVTSFGSTTFAYCTNLNSVTIGDSVTDIWSDTFACCSSLTSITIPNSVTTIWMNAFLGCESLTSVTIPNSVTCIRERAFSGCRSLTNVYYGGTEAEWKAISVVGNNNDKLTSAAVHYNSPMPQQTVKPAANTAYPSTQTVDVDGSPVEFQMYALKDASGNLTNYVKLRDVASVLNGTAAQFNVGWDGAVNIEAGKAYTPNGSEMSTPFIGERSYAKPTTATNIGGAAADLDAIFLTDDQGGGYTYYQLRDLGKALGFNVGWSAEKGVFLETDNPYDPNN